MRLHLSVFLVAALLAVPAAAQAPAASNSPPIGFETLAGDPFSQGLFATIEVQPGPPARAIASNVHGTMDGQAHVNVLRWTDARRFRGKLIKVQLSVRLDAAVLDTTARLWVRVVRADGSLGYLDEGLDAATGSTQWTTLASTGAIAEDAVDLCFGLVVEGTTLVHMHDFQILELGDATPLDVRFAIPERWAKHPDVEQVHWVDKATGLDVQVTTFVPPGHAPGTLARLWLLRPEDGLYRTYAAGRALLAAMQLGQEPPMIVSFVRGHADHLEKFVTHGLGSEDFRKRSNGSHPQGSSPQAVARLHDHGFESLSTLVAGQWEPVDSDSSRRAVRQTSQAKGALYSERVVVRWLDAYHAAHGDVELENLLFDAALATLEPWDHGPTVRQTSHSLVGHDCGHDHSSDPNHTHD